MGGADILSLLSLGQFIFDPDRPGGPLSAADPGGPLVPSFGTALGDPGWLMILCPLGLHVHWIALLRGCLVCCGCDVL